MTKALLVLMFISSNGELNYQHANSEYCPTKEQAEQITKDFITKTPNIVGARLVCFDFNANNKA